MWSLVLAVALTAAPVSVSVQLRAEVVRPVSVDETFGATVVVTTQPDGRVAAVALPVSRCCTS